MFQPSHSLSHAVLRTATTVLIALAGAAGMARADAANLTVELQGAGPGGGRMLAALYAAPEAWMKDGKAVAAQTVVKTDKVVMVFADLAPGRYAVSAFHDANDNGKLDTNPAGLPTEKYGFSRDAAGHFGPPGFEDAAIDLQADTRIVIHLH
jgi:uncharacterized protein (DUF2141 family)